LPAKLATRAPAKVNLSLRVLSRRADGYHELDSLVALLSKEAVELEDGIFGCMTLPVLFRT
jgi:4-diphosphocytidyl-2C-methyl-D-erythritol kinase